MKDDARIIADIEDRLRRLESRTFPIPAGGGIDHAMNGQGTLGFGSVTPGVEATLICNPSATGHKDDDSLYNASTGVYSVPDAGWYLFHGRVYGTTGRLRIYLPTGTTWRPEADLNEGFPMMETGGLYYIPAAGSVTMKFLPDTSVTLNFYFAAGKLG